MHIFLHISYDLIELDRKVENIINFRKVELIKIHVINLFFIG